MSEKQGSETAHEKQGNETPHEKQGKDSSDQKLPERKIKTGIDSVDKTAPKQKHKVDTDEDNTALPEEQTETNADLGENVMSEKQNKIDNDNDFDEKKLSPDDIKAKAKETAIETSETSLSNRMEYLSRPKKDFLDSLIDKRLDGATPDYAFPVWDFLPLQTKIPFALCPLPITRKKLGSDVCIAIYYLILMRRLQSREFICIISVEKLQIQ